MSTGIVKDQRFMNHDMGLYHVESPRRIEVLNRMVEDEIHFPYLPIEPRPAIKEEIVRVHSSAYFEFLRGTSGNAHVTLDPDTSTSPGTFETALLAPGGGLKAVELIMEGRIRNAFVLVRPPGHHAEFGRAMGFCFFNNIAIAAEHLVQKLGCRRVLIVDWDVHHGNGTQNAFYDRNRPRGGPDLRPSGGQRRQNHFRPRRVCAGHHDRIRVPHKRRRTHVRELACCSGQGNSLIGRAAGDDRPPLDAYHLALVFHHAAVGVGRSFGYRHSVIADVLGDPGTLCRGAPFPCDGFLVVVVRSLESFVSTS